LIPFVEPVANIAVLGLILAVGILGMTLVMLRKKGEPAWHGLLEGRAVWFSSFTVVAVLVGGVAEIVPTVIAGSAALGSAKNVPYSALELEGRDVYLKEGCYNCHSQMIRPFVWESARYGDISLADDSVFDHPFQWGSKRTGPDLARVGGKYNHQWHYRHMRDPREISPGSNMPSYKHLTDTQVDFARSADKLRAMRSVGVPYEPAQIQLAAASAREQAAGIVKELASSGEQNVSPDSELVALISYLQRLGRLPGKPALVDQVPLAVKLPEGGR
ncbi:MAG: Cytochrome c oxidase subunit CcoN, partial [Myxococcaceae bacterium]|nr:Cytochrome c oxidase subunit CcoN [Myxococcaceae bacterium]